MISAFKFKLAEGRASVEPLSKLSCSVNMPVLTNVERHTLLWAAQFPRQRIVNYVVKKLDNSRRKQTNSMDAAFFSPCSFFFVNVM